MHEPSSWTCARRWSGGSGHWPVLVCTLSRKIPGLRLTRGKTFVTRYNMANVNHALCNKDNGRALGDDSPSV
jgi:hypothetical protein